MMTSFRGRDSLYTECLVPTGEVDFYVLRISKGSFLSATPLRAVAPPSSFYIYYNMPAAQNSSLIKWQSPRGHWIVYILYLNSLSLCLSATSTVTRSSLRFSSLLSLSYWHRWKAVQYFYQSLLTRLFQATA
jgi:hypothetical protein